MASTPASAASPIEDSSNPVDFARFVASGPEPALEALARSQRERLEASGAPGTPAPVLVREEPAGPPAGILGSLTECDVAAARPGDPRRLSPGVPPGLVNTRLALRACAAAAGARPNDPRLGYQLGRVLDIAGRFAEARRFYEAAAGADYPAALFALGFMHRVGRGVDPDPARAAALVRRAAELGHAAARNTLGYHYLNGIGVPRSPEEAFRWVRLAADDGWASALDQLANLYRRGEGVGRDERKAFDLYAQAAGLGSTNAMNNLGRMLRDGAGVTRDVDAARTWFERASADGNAYAARELGQMHRRGAGAPKDTRRAAALYELAAERGFVEAYADLAAMYEGGDGPERDAGEAYFHYRLTLESGRRRERGFAHEAAEAGVARLGPRLTAEARALVEERLRDHLARLGPVPPLHAI